MDIALVYKWSRNPDDAYIRDDGTARWRRDNLTPSDDDAAAIAALRHMGYEGDNVCAVTVGNGDNTWAAARGVPLTYCAEALMPAGDEVQTASMLARAVQAAGTFDLVIMAEAQSEAGVAGLVAAKIGLPLVSGVNDLRASENAGEVLALRNVATSIDTLRVKLPALVAVAAVDAEKEVPSIRQMLAARKIPAERLELEVEEFAKTAVAGVRVPDKQRAKLFEGDIPQAVDALVAALRTSEVL